MRWPWQKKKKDPDIETGLLVKTTNDHRTLTTTHRLFATCHIHQLPNTEGHTVEIILDGGHLKGFKGMCDVAAAEALWRLGLPSCYSVLNAWLQAAKGEAFPAASVDEEKRMIKLGDDTNGLRQRRGLLLPLMSNGRLPLSKDVAEAYLMRNIPGDATLHGSSMVYKGTRIDVAGDPPSSYFLMHDTLTWAQGSGPGTPPVLAYLNRVPERVLKRLTRP